MKDLVSRLKEFLDNEAKSCSMDYGGVTPLEERWDRYLFQIEYEQLDNKEVKECLGKLENHQEQVYIT